MVLFPLYFEDVVKLFSPDVTVEKSVVSLIRIPL